MIVEDELVDDPEYVKVRRQLVSTGEACRQLATPSGELRNQQLTGGSRRVVAARQMFRRAIKWKLISDNPFTEIKAGTQTNKARQYFVPRETAQKVLDACPDSQWRLLFALSRYGGLRCPSEHLALKWSDVDWERSRIRVPSKKTEHHEGGDCRLMPIFPELRPYLLEVYQAREPGAEYVITRYRQDNANLRTQLMRIMARAGVKPWPKLFQNLRATRETELTEKFPIHVVCAWLGNSRLVAQKHYLQVTDAHFAQAAQQPASVGDPAAARAARNQAQQPAAEAQNASQSVETDSEGMDGSRGGFGTSRNNATPCENKGLYLVGDTGLEPVTSRV